MKKKLGNIIASVMIAALVLSGCTAAEPVAPVNEEKSQEAAGQEEKSGTNGDESGDYTEGLGDTFSGQTSAPEEDASEESEEESKDDKDVDLILFMGQSNMSGAAGDATLAPTVPEEAGMEFRAISDPTRLYPITEPFGINENNPTGLNEFPEAKKGSLVSAFVNEYHKETGRRVIAVSMSMGATDIGKWMSDGVMADVKARYDAALAYLNDNGYRIGHKYALWFHGESDGLNGTHPDTYKTGLDNVMRPLFIGGLQKVFIIVPGRTIDYRDVFLDIINVQKQICAESAYYAIATTVLGGVSAEYMKDQYHYNQHVLNMVGIESAKSVAYYEQHGKEKIVYDYRNGVDIVPEGADPDSQPAEDHLHFSDFDINEKY